MSESAPSCSCRLPWLVTIIALGILVAERVISVPTSSEAPSGTSDSQPVIPAPPPAPITTPDPRIATLQHDLSEVRRVLDDAQSALADRDREIATANDALRVLRLEVEALRTKQDARAP